MDYSQARTLYPAIVRTPTMDPLCEKYYSISPYAWCGNNPVNRIDPDGMNDDWVEDKNQHVYWDDNATSQATTKLGERYLGKEVFATDQYGDVYYGDSNRFWHTGATLPEVTVQGKESYKETIAYAFFGELSSGKLNDGGYGPWNPDAINFEVGANIQLAGVVNYSAGIGIITSGTHTGISVNATPLGGLMIENSLMNLKTLSMLRIGFYASFNMFESNMKNKMSLDVYKRTGINSAVQLGLFGFSHGQATTTPNTFNAYNSYGVIISSGVGVSLTPTYTWIFEPFK